MAVEIREIVIRTNITEPSQQKNDLQAQTQQMQKSLIEECVKRVMRMMKNRPTR